MKTEIEQLEAQLTAISEQIKELKNKPKFEVGKWYKNKFNCIIFNDGKHGYGVNMFEWVNIYSDSEKPLFYNSLGLDWQPATPEEVKAALVKEAEKRGFKFGVYIDNTNIYPDYKSSIPWPLRYHPFTFDNNELSYGGAVVFDKGQWATIIKDDVIKVGSYEVKFEGEGNKRCTSIDGNIFTERFWQSARIISEHSKAKIMVGCSKQFDVSLETINKILDKL